MKKRITLILCGIFVCTVQSIVAVTPQVARMQNANDVHLNSEGYDFLGRHVAASIGEALK